MGSFFLRLFVRSSVYTECVCVTVLVKYVTVKLSFDVKFMEKNVLLFVEISTGNIFIVQRGASANFPSKLSLTVTPLTKTQTYC